MDGMGTRSALASRRYQRSLPSSSDASSDVNANHAANADTHAIPDLYPYFTNSSSKSKSHYSANARTYSPAQYCTNIKNLQRWNTELWRD